MTRNHLVLIKTGIIKLPFQLFSPAIVKQFVFIKKTEPMKPFIHHTSFGSITVDDQTFDHDILIRSNGKIEKRKKKLSKKVYGTSHTLSLEEAEFIYEEGISKLIIGCGQYGALGLSAEAEDFFRKKEVFMIQAETPVAIREYNKSEESCIGLFHVTC